jgi:hypothetical protein
MSSLVTVYVDQRSGDWTIERHAVSKRTGFTVATGAVEKIQKDQLERRAPVAILSALATFGAEENPGLSEIDALSHSKRESFLSSQVILDIFLQDSSTVVVQLMRRVGTGRIGDSVAKAACRREELSRNIVAIVHRLMAD